MGVIEAGEPGIIEMITLEGDVARDLHIALRLGLLHFEVALGGASDLGDPLRPIEVPLGL
jgi:hypothetical protein